MAVCTHRGGVHVVVKKRARPVLLVLGHDYPADVVKAAPWAFGGEAPNAMPVESATAAPGEKRVTKKPAAKK